MAEIAKQITELIGRTPMLQLCNFQEDNNVSANIIAKLEYFNPLGSVKDRVAYAMIEDGIKQGKINRAYKRQYGNRTCWCVCRKEIKAYSYYA